MSDLPDEEIEAAESDPGAAAHDHSAVTAQDGTLAEHLRSAHDLDVDADMSAGTLEGLHDRLHDSSNAADD